MEDFQAALELEVRDWRDSRLSLQPDARQHGGPARGSTNHKEALVARLPPPPPSPGKGTLETSLRGVPAAAGDDLPLLDRGSECAFDPAAEAADAQAPAFRFPAELPVAPAPPVAPAVQPTAEDARPDSPWSLPVTPEVPKSPVVCSPVRSSGPRASLALASPTVRLTPDMCERMQSGRFKLKWKQHGAFQSVWTTAGAPSEKQLSIWRPLAAPVARGLFGTPKAGATVVRERIFVGHYACTNFSAPAGALVLEVTDTSQTGFFAKPKRDSLKRFVDVFFPHPTRYRQVWRNATSSPSTPLFIWEPIPPAQEYVALGMAATTDGEPPPVEKLRCMPRPWAEPVAGKLPTSLWTGTSVDGSHVNLWTVGGSKALFCATASADAAAATAPDMLVMSEDKFYASLPPEA